MEATVLSSAAVMDRLSDDFVIAHLYVDDKTEDAEFRTLGRRYRDLEMSRSTRWWTLRATPSPAPSEAAPRRSS